MRQIPRLCLPQVPLRALFEAPIMVIWETEIACQDFITTIRPILLRWDNVGWRGCPSLLIFIKCLCCKWLVLRIRVEILESSSFKWQRWRKAMAGQAWLLQGPSGLGPVCLLAILWPPLDHAPVKQTFSEKDSEPLKTVSFPGASEVPLDPVFCAREVHTEAFLHAIHQVLDDTHTLPLGSYSLPVHVPQTQPRWGSSWTAAEAPLSSDPSTGAEHGAWQRAATCKCLLSLADWAQNQEGTLRGTPCLWDKHSRSNAMHLAKGSWTSPNASDPSQQVEPNNTTVQKHTVHCRCWPRFPTGCSASPPKWLMAIRESLTCMPLRREGTNTDSHAGAQKIKGRRKTEWSTVPYGKWDMICADSQSPIPEEAPSPPPMPGKERHKIPAPEPKVTGCNLNKQIYGNSYQWWLIFHHDPAFEKFTGSNKQ